MLISDWSSDVCSSDLVRTIGKPIRGEECAGQQADHQQSQCGPRRHQHEEDHTPPEAERHPGAERHLMAPRRRCPVVTEQNGRQSISYSVCPYVSITIVTVA